MSDWSEWVAKITHGETSREVGERIGYSHTTALKWMHNPTPEHAVALVLAYDADLIEAMVAAGWLSAAEVNQLNLDAQLRRVDGVKLAGEMYRRAVVHAKRGTGAANGHVESRLQTNGKH